MIKKTIKYVDYDGNERTEEIYFNLSASEIAEMEFSSKEGLAERINSMIKEENKTEILKFFTELVTKSYGVKSSDGRVFMKNKELLEEFVHSQAYDTLFMELLTNTELAAEFVNGIIPKPKKQ